MDPRLVLARRFWRQFSTAALDLVMPPVCVGCSQNDGGELLEELCAPCRRNLHRMPGGCGRCGEATLPGGRCTASHERLRNLSGLLAPFRFAGTGGRLVRRFKLDGNAKAGGFLARAMAERLRAFSGRERALVVSVPLHARRRRQRGFDQAQWLASAVARRLGLRLGAGVLQRTRLTRPQGDPTVLSRVENVRGVFRLNEPELVHNRQVVLVDDVFTTGATARSCARLLRGAGATGVRVLVACRS